MTNSKFSDFIRNATPEEKARVYGEVIDDACEMQRKVMTDTEEGRALKELIGQYWDIAWAEGREDRKHDTITGDGQRTWMAIEDGIDTLARQLAEANANVEKFRRQAKEAISLLQISNGHYERMTRLQALKLKAAERRAAEVEQKAKRYDWLRDKSYGQRQHPIVVSQHRMSYASIDTTHYVGPLFGDALDQAIDAAIAAGEKT